MDPWRTLSTNGFDLRTAKPPVTRGFSRNLWPCRNKEGWSGGAEEDRTPDLRIANAALSQLSYGPTTRGERRFGWSGPAREGRIMFAAPAYVKRPIGRPRRRQPGCFPMITRACQSASTPGSEPAGPGARLAPPRRRG